MFNEMEIINKLKEEKTLVEISRELNLPVFEVHKRIMAIKNKGFLVDKFIYDDGNIIYYIKDHLSLDSGIALKLKNRHNLSLMVVSDTHFGNAFACMDYSEKIYDYCRDNDIHVIINGGDFVDGSFNRMEQIISNPLEQLDYTIKNYPFEEDILNLICLGNHDFSLFKSGVDIKSFLENSRSDLIPLGYGLGIINVEDDQIFVKHNIPDYIFRPICGKLVLEGHKHKMAFTDDNGFLVNIPTLSDITLQKYRFPGAIRMDLSLNGDGHIISSRFEQFIFDGHMCTVSESFFNFDFDCEKIKEENVMPKLKVKKYDYNKLSQIEKFNRKWGRN